MSQPFIGEIQTFAGNFAPRGYAICNGQLLAIAQNTALFSILGTTYGGDGRTTFGLPNLNGRTPIHPGNGPGLDSVRLGENKGTDTHTLTEANIPAHTHGIGPITLPTSDAAATLKSAAGNVPAQPAQFAYGDSPDSRVNITAPTETGLQGSAQPIDNRNPSLTLFIIIATQGTYPSRS